MSVLVFLLSLVACPTAETRVEGSVAGDCSDAADNDIDGQFDCLDDGCAGSPDCVDETDSDTDADADSDADADADTDTDADTDADTDTDADPAARWAGTTRMPAGYTLTGGSKGVAVADLDGDGQDDLVLGDSVASASADWGGAVYLLRGPITADLDGPAVAYATIAGSTDQDFAGATVAALPDVDGDGAADVAIGAAGIGAVPGQACVFPGTFAGAAGMEEGRCWTGDAVGARAGWVVSAAEDLTGDGAPDLLVGAPYSAFWIREGGGAYVVDPTSAPGALEDGAVHVYGDATSLLLGTDLVEVGDVDGDGASDLAIGAYGYSDGSGARMGEILVFHGPLAGHLAASDADASLHGHDTETWLGYGPDAIAERVDVDGDGRDDLVAGATYPMGVGEVWVVHGQNLVGDVDSLFVDATLTGEAHQDAFGQGVVGLDDADGDGADDVGIAAPGADPHGESSGTVYLAYGPVSGNIDAADLPMFDGDAYLGYLGIAMGAGSFDLTGDGVRDLLLGSTLGVYVVPGGAP